MKWCIVIVAIVLALAWWSANQDQKNLQKALEPPQFAPFHETRGRRGRGEVQPESIPRGRGRLYPDTEGR